MEESLEKQHEDLIDSLILTTITNGTTSFDQLLISLPGIYPSVLLNALRRLSLSSLIDSNIYESALTLAQCETEPRQQTISFEQHRIKFPVQHPLDYEWRFHEVASKRLLGEATSVLKSGESLALLGTPSILRTAIEHQYSRPIILLDANPILVHNFAESAPEANVIRIDISKDLLPVFEASAVILDSPWYKEHIKLFLWAACRLLRSDGHLFICMPPIGTRPGINYEMEDILHWARQDLGLSLLRIDKAVLPYLMPLFEYNALRAEGILNVPKDWRRGDLWVFKTNDILRTALIKPTVTDVEIQFNELWDEVLLWGMRVRLRVKKDFLPVFEDPSLSSIVEKDVLPSVSRRDPHRQLVDVWTSGNRIYSSRGPHILARIIRAISVNQNPHEQVAAYLERELSTIESSLISKAIHQVTEIANLERNESLRYYGE